MSAIFTFFFICTLAFMSFCFYCGVSTIGEKLKKDGLYSLLEITFIVFLATALVVLAVGKVDRLLFGNPQSIQNERVYNV